MEARERLSVGDGLFLLTQADLLPLGQLARRERFRRFPEPVVTYVVDTNPNYTNYCETDCLFCAFYRKPGDPAGYLYTVEQMVEKFKEHAALGATTILLQGGNHPDLTLDYHVALVRECRRQVPQVTPHFFSPSEIRTLARVCSKTVPEVLQALWDAGQRTIPGGGAEILSNRVKQRISPKKGTAEDWLDVMREAHGIGFRTTATMMYGHVETDEEILEHLDRLRRLQDETGGFTAFIPWCFKPTNTWLEPKVTHVPGSHKYLRVLAVARLFLDNFDHVQASWFSEGKKAGQIALHFGADDFGGTILEENVLASAEHHNRTTIEEIRDIIRESGFVPAQRTTTYEILRRFDEAPVVLL
ncbi:MAG: dehypoxanthine futalosine cyclase [Candidatus Eisenbacteria bacterium]|nr:dehypoxanthine futalosine cyclase [Candidatus Eisenbacteria bacterium]